MVKFVEFTGLSEERCGEISLALLRRNAIVHKDWGDWALGSVLGQDRRALGNKSKRTGISITDLKHFRDILLGVVEDDLSEGEKATLAWKIHCSHAEIYSSGFQLSLSTLSTIKLRRQIGSVAKEADVKYDELISFFYLLFSRSLAARLGIKKTA